MGPSSFQWCPVTGQGAMGTNWSTGSSSWTCGRISSLWEWRSTGTRCPGRLWSLLLQRYSRPAWTRSSAACCRCPCFGRRVGLDDPRRSLPTPTICDSVIISPKMVSWLQERRQGSLVVLRQTHSETTRCSYKFWALAFSSWYSNISPAEWTVIVDFIVSKVWFCQLLHAAVTRLLE